MYHISQVFVHINFAYHIKLLAFNNRTVSVTQNHQYTNSKSGLLSHL